MTEKPPLILIAGPYRSGTDDDPAAMAANLQRREAGADQDVAIDSRRGLPIYCDLDDLPGRTVTGHAS